MEGQVDLFILHSFYAKFKGQLVLNKKCKSWVENLLAFWHMIPSKEIEADAVTKKLGSSQKGEKQEINSHSLYKHFSDLWLSLNPTRAASIPIKSQKPRTGIWPAAK